MTGPNKSIGELALDVAKLVDTTTAPTQNGEVRLDGTTVKVQTDGTVKSLSDIGSGGGSTSDSRIQMFARRGVSS